MGVKKSWWDGLLTVAMPDTEIAQKVECWTHNSELQSFVETPDWIRSSSALTDSPCLS